jgi:hypothetical protein
MERHCYRTINQAWGTGISPSIVDDVDLAGIETGLKLCQWNVELKYGSVPFGSPRSEFSTKGVW